MYLGLNPDGYLLPGSLERAHTFLTHKQKAFLCEMNTEPIAHPKWYDPITGLTDWVSGVAFFIDEAAFNLLEGFDNNFPMYCEDVDLSLKARQLNRKIIYAPKSIILHSVSQSLGEHSYKKNIMKLKNQLKIFWKHATGIQLISISFYWLLFHLPYQLIRWLYLRKK